MSKANPGKVNLEEKFGLFFEQWSPRVVGHAHENEDELFYMVRGQLLMRLRDREELLNPGTAGGERTVTDLPSI